MPQKKAAAKKKPAKKPQRSRGKNATRATRLPPPMPVPVMPLRFMVGDIPYIPDSYTIPSPFNQGFVPETFRITSQKLTAIENAIKSLKAEGYSQPEAVKEVQTEITPVRVYKPRGTYKPRKVKETPPPFSTNPETPFSTPAARPPTISRSTSMFNPLFNPGDYERTPQRQELFGDPVASSSRGVSELIEMMENVQVAPSAFSREHAPYGAASDKKGKGAMPKKPYTPAMSVEARPTPKKTQKELKNLEIDMKPERLKRSSSATQR